MTKPGLFVIWSSLLGVCFPAWPGQTQVPKPEQCLISRMYSLIQLPETKDDGSCWNKCMAEPNCHMAVVTKPLSASKQCLLVNCLNQGIYSTPRDPSTEISVYPKSSMEDEQREFLRERAYQAANERLRCFDSISDSGCRSGVLRFFYNSTSYRCEQSFSGCGSNKNSFETRGGCEALCNEKYRCYRPRQYGGCSGQFSKFFYNVTSQRCERFDFSGCGSNGNIFGTAEECEQLCGDGEDDKSSASIPGSRIRQPAVGSAVLCFVIPVFLVLVAFVVRIQLCRWSQCPRALSDKSRLLSESDVSEESG